MSPNHCFPSPHPAGLLAATPSQDLATIPLFTDIPDTLVLHRSMHENLRRLRAGETKHPSEMLDEALKQSAQVVLLLAGHQNVELEDRIQLLFEAGDFYAAQGALERFYDEANWCKRWLYNRQHGQMVKAIRCAVRATAQRDTLRCTAPSCRSSRR